MDEVRREALGGIHHLERELIVRDFVSLLNVRAHKELHAFLAEDVTYRPSPHRSVEGRKAVTKMIADLHSSFEEFSTTLVALAVTGDRVLTEQRLRLRTTGTEAVDVMGFASFTLHGFQIVDWNQVHA